MRYRDLPLGTVDALVIAAAEWFDAIEVWISEAHSRATASDRRTNIGVWE
jgi:hypothetical protein